jgi:hypothetical protein
MILYIDSNDRITFNVDLNFYFVIDHDSTPVKTANGLTRFVDRGYSTYRAFLKFTDLTANVEALIAWMNSHTSSNVYLSYGAGEEIFGTHLSSNSFRVTISNVGPAMRLNLMQSSFEFELTKFNLDKSLLPAMKNDIQATMDNLRFPLNYEMKGMKAISYFDGMKSEFKPDSKCYTSNQFSGVFRLNDTELAEFLKYWETNRHNAFATPTLIAPLFIPARSSSTLRIASVGEISKANRYLWDVPISFVIGSF